MRSIRPVFLAIGIISFGAATACGGPQPWLPPAQRDAREDPESLRPGYGSSGLGTWFPLTAPERDALANLDKAKAGDPDALLALSFVAAGNHRDAASHARYKQRVDGIVAGLRPKMKSLPDDRQRGLELHRTLHAQVFDHKAELGGYELDQSRVTEVLDRGRFNCISSSMLYVVLGRYFDLPVRGVLVPTHAFVELGRPGTKPIDVETTAETGFDLVHDARFYADQASQFSSKRGLKPLTLEEYRDRVAVPPYVLMARGMENQAGDKEATPEEKGRLAELSGFVDRDNEHAQEIRFGSLAIDAQELAKVHAARTLTKMFDTVGASAADAATRFPKAIDLQRFVWWLGAAFADALMVVGRTDQALALADEGLQRVDPSWKDGKELRGNFLGILSDRMAQLVNAKDFTRASHVFDKHFEVCRADEVCLANQQVLYGNWAVDAANAGDYSTARQALQECLARVPGAPQCTEISREVDKRAPPH